MYTYSLTSLNKGFIRYWLFILFKMSEKKKKFLSKLLDKLDNKLEKKSEEKKCQCCQDSEDKEC